MKISEIDANSRKVSIEAKVIDKGEARSVRSRDGRDLRVSDAVLEDDSGSIQLTLWGDEIDKINIGDKVKIENGFVREWNNTLQLSVGKFGKMTVL